MASSAGYFVHPKAVMEFAYDLVREYEDWDREQDRVHDYRNIWHKMRGKCKNRSNWHYKRYGAKGVRVCPEWDASLEKFKEDMGHMPDGVIGVCRKDKNENFNPENTVWKF